MISLLKALFYKDERVINVDPQVRKSVEKHGYDVVRAISNKENVWLLEVNSNSEKNVTFRIKFMQKRQKQTAETKKIVNVYEKLVDLNHHCITHFYKFIDTVEFSLLVTENTSPFSIHQRLEKVFIG